MKYINKNLSFSLIKEDNKDSVIIELLNKELTVNKKLKINQGKNSYIQENITQYYIKHEDEYSYPISLRWKFFDLMKMYGLKIDSSKRIERANKSYDKIEFNFNKEIVPRDYQWEYLNQVKIRSEKHNIFLIDLFVGMGKTLIVCKIIEYFSLRVGLIILPKYIEKWKGDLNKYLGVTEDEIYVVQGSESIHKIPDNTKVVIFSIDTLNSLFKNNKENTLEIFRDSSIGLLVNDETHQHFHAVVKCLSLLDAKYFVGSTATLQSKSDYSMNRLYWLLFPNYLRIKDIVKIESHVNTIAINYCSILDIKKIRFKGFNNYYNHHLFEQSILNNHKFKDDYYKMIDYYLIDYSSKMEKDDKIVVYFKSLDMINDYKDHLLELDELKSFKIGKYTGGDDYNSMLELNIIVSNGQMLGTAIDIPNLICVLNTAPIRSDQLNIQLFGRLRKQDNKEVYYLYFYNSKFYHHIQLHNAMSKSIKSKSKTYLVQYYVV